MFLATLRVVSRVQVKNHDIVRADTFIQKNVYSNKTSFPFKVMSIFLNNFVFRQSSNVNIFKFKSYSKM